MGPRAEGGGPGQKQRSAVRTLASGQAQVGVVRLGQAPGSPLCPFPGHKQGNLVGEQQTVSSPSERKCSILGNGGRRGSHHLCGNNPSSHGHGGKGWPGWQQSCRLLASPALCWPNGRTAWCRARLPGPCPQRPQSEGGDMVLSSDHHRTAACPSGETPTGPSQMGEHLSHVFR